MKTLLVLVWYALLVSLCQTKKCLGCMEQERIGLLQLRAARIIGENYSYPIDLHTWVDDESSDCCGWERVKCSNTTQRVIQLSLGGVFLFNPFLASWFMPFQELRYLDFSQNCAESYGGIKTLRNLKYLEDLNLAGNWFEKSILLSLGAHTSLKALNISKNGIQLDKHGLIRVLTNFSNLEVLDLSDNVLSYIKGLGLSNLTKLRILDLSVKSLYGPEVAPTFHLNDLETLTGICEMRSLENLDLSENQFKGVLPACLGNLTNLRKLDVSNNQFFGNLSQSLVSNITSLEYLSFNDNQLDGSYVFTSLTSHKSQFDVLGFSNCRLDISAEQLLSVLYNQHKLTGIDLSHNNLHGNFPNWIIINNTKLETLTLANNSLEGQIHFPLSRPTKMKWIDISMNHIRGQVQTSIGLILPQLIHFNISRNNLEGRFPASMRNMKDLKDIDLSNNRLDGHIPHTIYNMTNLRSLQLSNNRFTRNISDAKMEFSNSLRILDLGYNNLSGPIPRAVLNTNLLMLILQNNYFHGPVPAELCDNDFLRHLDFSQNQLSGHIPSCLLKVAFLHLQHNKLTGPIPKSPNYPVILDLSHNKVSGSIPDTIGLSDRNPDANGLAIQMRVLLLGGNRLSGSVPHSLCRLQKISLMDLSHNMLSGSLPPCFSNITMFGNIREIVENDGFLMFSEVFGDNVTEDFASLIMQKLPQEEEFLTKSRMDSYKGDILINMGGLDLSCNKLTEEIPQEMGALTAIHSLNLSHNQLTGSIPKTMSNMKTIESLDLSHNKLSREIPFDLNSITTLEVFIVAYNNLSGRLPDMKAQFATFNETCYEGNPLLCGPPLLEQCNTSHMPPTTVTVSESSNEPWMDLISFLSSFGAAYIMCLLGIAAALYINPYWRHTWFNFVDTCLSFIFPFWSEIIYSTRCPLYITIYFERFLFSMLLKYYLFCVCYYYILLFKIVLWS